MKRLLDLVGAFFGMIILSPLFLVVMVLIWFQDFKSPLYISPRVGKGGKEFKMIKLRSMRVHLANSGPLSTSSDDDCITSVGYFIRKFKLDELSQLWNVFKGDMSLVGPRPNVKEETDLYTIVEKEILSAKPGITDFSSIVFSDEANILTNTENPDLAYNQLVRPWKSRLGLIYIENRTFALDLQIIIYTVVSIFRKKLALAWVSTKLEKLGVDENVIDVCRRQKNLTPFPPPGASEVVTHR